MRTIHILQDNQQTRHLGEPAFYFANKKGVMKMVKLKKPVLCEVDENYFVSAADFRSYAHCMMYPDPVGIVMSGKLNDMVTGAVNDGKLTIKEAFDKLVKRNAHGFIDYSYSDGTDGYLPGRELLEFYDEATAAELIEAR
jgi:hypothetical protein